MLSRQVSHSTKGSRTLRRRRGRTGTGTTEETTSLSEWALAIADQYLVLKSSGSVTVVMVKTVTYPILCFSRRDTIHFPHAPLPPTVKNTALVDFFSPSEPPSARLSLNRARRLQRRKRHIHHTPHARATKIHVLYSNPSGRTNGSLKKSMSLARICGSAFSMPCPARSGPS
jgi:hypothetical protein